MLNYHNSKIPDDFRLICHSHRRYSRRIVLESGSTMFNTIFLKVNIYNANEDYLFTRGK